MLTGCSVAACMRISFAAVSGFPLVLTTDGGNTLLCLLNCCHCGQLCSSGEASQKVTTREQQYACFDLGLLFNYSFFSPSCLRIHQRKTSAVLKIYSSTIMIQNIVLIHAWTEKSANNLPRWVPLRIDLMHEWRISFKARYGCFFFVVLVVHIVYYSLIKYTCTILLNLTEDYASGSCYISLVDWSWHKLQSKRNIFQEKWKGLFRPGVFWKRSPEMSMKSIDLCVWCRHRSL